MAGKEYKKSTDEKKPKKMGCVQDFLGYVERYWEDTQKDNFPRYMSWVSMPENHYISLPHLWLVAKQ